MKPCCACWYLKAPSISGMFCLGSLELGMCSMRHHGRSMGASFCYLLFALDELCKRFLWCCLLVGLAGMYLFIARVSHRALHYEIFWPGFKHIFKNPVRRWSEAVPAFHFCWLFCVHLIVLVYCQLSRRVCQLMFC